MLKKYSLLLLAGFFSRLSAQAPQPVVLDTVFDLRQHALRVILGTLGASLVGGAIESGMPLSLAEVSPSRDYVLAVNGNNGSLSVLKTVSGQVTSNPVNAPAQPGKLSLSPTGQSAVLLYPRDRLLIVLTGLPDNPHINRSVSLGGAGVYADRLAVSDDGQAVAVSVRQSETSFQSVRAFAAASLYMDYSGVLQRVEDVADVSAVAFIPGGEDILAADGNRLLRGNNGTAGPEWTVAAIRDSAQAAIDGIGVSADGKTIFAISVSGEVLQLDSNNSQFLTVANCACAPTGMFRMPGNAGFRLNNLPDAPLWVFDGDSAPARMVFIPVEPLAGQGTAAGKESRQ